MKLRVKDWPPSSIALAGFIALVPFETAMGGLRLALLWAAAAAWIAESIYERSRAADRGWAGALREVPWVSSLATSAGLLAACAACAAFSAARKDRGDAIEALFARGGAFIIALPLLFNLGRRACGPPESAPLARKLDSALWLSLAAWGAWLLISSCHSIKAERSFRLLYKEAGPYLIACALTRIKMGRGADEALRWLKTHASVGRVIAMVALAVLAMAYAGPASWEDYFAHNDWIRGARGPHGERIVRVQWPFDEHNRLASYLLAVALLAPAAWVIAAPGRERAKLAASCGVMLGAMLFTGTRGGAIAAALGLALFAFVRPRIPLLIVAACALIILFVPSGMPEHLRSIFKAETYRDPGGNVQGRLRAYDAALRMIRERPILGLGYGWTNFEAMHKRYREQGLDREAKPHAHNNFLEVTAESGLAGLAIFLAHQAALMAAIIALMRAGGSGSPERALGWALLGLMAGLHAFGMTNFTLRRTVGFEVWMAWGAVHALAVDFLARREG